jgi:hypothetical protein
VLRDQRRARFAVHLPAAHVRILDPTPA